MSTTNLLALLTTFCVLLITGRYFRSGNFTYFFLAWNLFLAWVPLFVAMLAKRKLADTKHKRLILLLSFALWLLFFPNAPYIITDLVHLNSRFQPALWPDTLLLFSCAHSGLLVGLLSLYKMHKLLLNQYSELKSSVVMLGSLVLTGFGIFLGRVQRWNSWDLFTQPGALLSDIFKQLTNPQAIQMTIGFSALLILVYYVLKGIIINERSEKEK